MDNNDNLNYTTEQFKDNANKLKNEMIHDNNSKYIPNFPIIFISIFVGIISLCVSGVFPTIFSTIFSTIFPAIFSQFSEIFSLMLIFLYSVISLLLWYIFRLILYVIPILILLAVLAYRQNQRKFIFRIFDILIKYANLVQHEDKNDTTINIFYKYCVMKIFSYKFKNTIKTNTIFINAGICYLAICVTENKDEINQKFLGIYGTWIPLPF